MPLHSIYFVYSVISWFSGNYLVFVFVFNFPCHPYVAVVLLWVFSWEEQNYKHDSEHKHDTDTYRITFSVLCGVRWEHFASLCISSGIQTNLKQWAYRHEPLLADHFSTWIWNGWKVTGLNNVIITLYLVCSEALFIKLQLSIAFFFFFFWSRP